MITNQGIDSIVSTLIVLFVGLGVHEYAHAKMADLAGDPTPRLYGRVTLNVFRHLDLLGTMMIIMTTFSGFGIGWAKPVPIDPRKMHNPRWDHFWVVAAGPISNLIQAAIYAIIFRLILMFGVPIQSEFLIIFLETGVFINLLLCFFNLIPLGPLDGQWMLGTFLDEPQRYQWNRWNLRRGTLILLLVLVFGMMVPSMNIFSHILGPLIRKTGLFLLGGRIS